MRRVLILAAALALAGCATPGIVVGSRPSSIERVTAGYLRVRGPAALAIDHLPEPARSRAGAALILADAAFAVVRSDASPIERAAAAADLVR